MLNICCINSNNYQNRGVEYVNNLHRMISENCSVPHRFVCFTDDFEKLNYQDYGYGDGIDVNPLPDPEFKRWWHKLSLFKPGLFPKGDRVLYFDLDTVIMGNIDDLAAYDGPFCMTQSFGAAGDYGGLQSGIMAWKVDAHIETPGNRHVGVYVLAYDEYVDAGCPTDYPGGDQAWIERWTSYRDTWADICPGKVASYKFHLHGEYDNKASVVYFHGYPRPHEVGGWAWAAWSGEKGEPVEFVATVKFMDVCNTADKTIDAQIRENIAREIPRVRLNKHEALLVGGGPSVADFVDDIRDKQRAGAQVFAMNGSGRWLIGKGIVPDYHIVLDARPENIDFLNYERSHKTVFLLASQCHPSLFDFLKTWEHSVKLWHIADDDKVTALLKETEPGAALIAVSSTVGITALNLAWVMGYRRADLYGYDSSSAGQDAHHAYPQRLNDKALTDDYTFNGKLYRAQRALASQANHFITFYQMLENIGMGIEVHGEGLLPDMWRHEESVRAASHVSLEAEEAYKYRRCWQTKEYREYSPGVVLIEDAIEALNPAPGSTFIDFGCGTGRPAQRLVDRGFKVLCIDHVSNCFDAGILLPFCKANLWELPEGFEPADYGICTDVMEHIHEHKIDAVLSGIAKHVKKAVFFNCAGQESLFGHALAVGDLHVTVRPPDWWAGKLYNHFPIVEHKGSGIFVCRKENS